MPLTRVCDSDVVGIHENMISPEESATRLDNNSQATLNRPSFPRQGDAPSANEFSQDCSNSAPEISWNSIVDLVPKPLEYSISITELPLISHEKKIEVALEEQISSFASLLSIAPETEDECCICLEAYTSDNPRVKGSCNHHFHLPCLLSWKQRSSLCPMCCAETLRDVDALGDFKLESVSDREKSKSSTPAQDVSADEAYALKLQKIYLRRMLRRARSSAVSSMRPSERSTNAQASSPDASFFQPFLCGNRFISVSSADHQQGRASTRDQAFQPTLSSPTQGSIHGSLQTVRRNESTCCLM